MVADIITGSLVRASSHSYKSYLTYFVPPLRAACENLKSACINVTNFVRQRLYQETFQPFRVHLKDGRSYEILHPNLGLAADAVFIIGIPAPDDPASTRSAASARTAPGKRICRR